MNSNQLWLLVAAVVAIVTGVFLWQGKKPEPSATITLTAEEVLHRWAEALGGVEKLKGIENTYTKIEIKTAGLTGVVEDWQTIQGQHRQSVDLAGVYKSLTVFDGSKGWNQDHNRKIQELSGTDLEDEITTAYLGSYSYFFSDRKPGKVEYLGEDKSKKNYVVKLLPAGGKPITYYLDKKSFLPVKSERPDAERTMTATMSDWRGINGIKTAFSIHQTSGDPRSEVQITVQEVRFNQALDQAVFAKLEETASDLHFAQQHSALGIPFELNSNHIYLQGRINGSPVWFLLDTGASLRQLTVSLLPS